tara:strand:+ start:728 stop:928 length:201 start_codon:yes stop_codon:yes gene_type:complete
MNEETGLQQLYREKALEHIKELCFALSVAEQDNLNDLVKHMVKIRSLASKVSSDLAALNVLTCHSL